MSPKHSVSASRSRVLAWNKLSAASGSGRVKRRSSSALLVSSPLTRSSSRTWPGGDSAIQQQYQQPAASASSLSAMNVGMAMSSSEPTREQLVRVFQRAAIPMIGFGFVDQTIMLQAGHAIDCTIGVTFGLSTLTSAAFGQVCSDASGAMFGSTLERFAERLGLPAANLTPQQKSLKVVQRAKFLGNLLGVVTGCLLGLLNLLFIDTDRSSTLKLQAFAGDDGAREFDFTIEASNANASGTANRSGIPSTILTVRGPDVDGILASMTAALAAHGCSLVELHAGRGKRAVMEAAASTANRGDDDDGTRAVIEDVFHVVKRETSQPYDDDELEDLAKTLLEATRSPVNVHAVKSKMMELEKLNALLHERCKKLEQVVIDKQITIVPSYAESAS